MKLELTHELSALVGKTIFNYSVDSYNNRITLVLETPNQRQYENFILGIDNTSDNIKYYSDQSLIYLLNSPITAVIKVSYVIFTENSATKVVDYYIKTERHTICFKMVVSSREIEDQFIALNFTPINMLTYTKFNNQC